jgi:hypothetical protein
VTEHYDYDVALSYAGEDGHRAQQLAFALRRRGVRVFYDKDEAARLWGENLYTFLTELYQRRARYCVPLLSQHYADKPWTRRELAAAQARAFAQKRPYLLHVRLDDAEVPGVLPTEAFVPWSGETSDTIADFVLARLRGEPSAPESAPRRLERLDWRDLQPDYFEPFDAADAAVDPREALERVYADIWLPYEDEIWSATVTNGLFRLANRTDARAVRYKYLRIGERDMGESPVSVETRLDPVDNMSAAGLLYRFDAERRHYYAFVVAGGNQYRFYSRDGSGFRILYAGRFASGQPGQFHKVAIVGSGPAMRLYINDTFVKKVEDEGLRGGYTGILGVGRGTFEFDNFTIYR